jgi:hypothetical protein
MSPFYFAAREAARCCPVPHGRVSAAGESGHSIRSPTARHPPKLAVAGCPSHSRRAFVHGGGLPGVGVLSRRLRCAQARSNLTGVPEARTYLTPACIPKRATCRLSERDDATKLEGSVIGTVAYRGFALANAGHDDAALQTRPGQTCSLGRDRLPTVQEVTKCDDGSSRGLGCRWRRRSRQVHSSFRWLASKQFHFPDQGRTTGLPR